MFCHDVFHRDQAILSSLPTPVSFFPGFPSLPPLNVIFMGRLLGKAGLSFWGPWT